jgi:large subunit ribosomal protein L22
MNKAVVYAKSKYVRTSVKKVAPVMDMVRGKDIAEARRILKFDKTKASDLVLTTLNSAVANARNNLNLSETDLYIADLYVNNGPTLKRGRIVARGKFHQILKRTSHIIVGLSERQNK